jgi:hypothetical protein
VNVLSVPKIFVDDFEQSFVSHQSNRQLLFVPPICGFIPLLRARISAVAASLSEYFGRIRLVEFPGQNGRPGMFSVRNSAEALTTLLQQETKAEFKLFGMCCGATACVTASVQMPNVIGLILWEMTPRYVYDTRHRLFYERRFSISVCNHSYLSPLQPIDLVSQLNCDTTYATAFPSRYCDDAGQIELLSRTARAKWRRVRGVTHLLEGDGQPSGIVDLFH